VRRKLKVRHKILSRGDEKMIINYVPKTGAIIDAALLHNGKIIEVTADIDRINEWIKLKS